MSSTPYGAYETGGSPQGAPTAIGRPDSPYDGGVAGDAEGRFGSAYDEAHALPTSSVRRAAAVRAGFMLLSTGDPRERSGARASRRNVASRAMSSRVRLAGCADAQRDRDRLVAELFDFFGH